MTLMFELIKHMASSLPAASNALIQFILFIYLFIYLFIFSSKWWDQICQVSSSSAKQKSLVSIEKKKKIKPRIFDHLDTLLFLNTIYYSKWNLAIATIS